MTQVVLLGTTPKVLSLAQKLVRRSLRPHHAQLDLKANEVLTRLSGRRQAIPKPE